MKIVFAIPSLFPFGVPYSSRALNFCRLLRDCGHEVVLFCDYLSEKELKKENGVASFEGIEIRYVTDERNILDKATVMYRTPHNLDQYIAKNRVDLLFTSSVSNRIERIIKIGRKHNLPIMLESCEKFHPSNWKYGKYDYRYLRFKHCWDKVYCQADGVIAISRFLQQHFQDHDIATIRIPTILDVSSREWSSKRSHDDDIIRFVFAGGLGGGKDRVAEMIEAISLLPDEKRRRIQFNIYGPSKDAVAAQLGNKVDLLERIKENVLIHGRVPQQQIPQIVMENDFGIILRPERESSNAGFPTKLAECMEVGTPIFANQTGDIDLYVKDGITGYVVDDPSTEAIRRALEKVLLLNDEDLTQMRNKTRQMAETSFDYRKYSGEVETLLESLCKDK